MPHDMSLAPSGPVRAVESLTEAFDARSVRYALIGGLAFTIRGRPRFTRDVDFLIDVPQIVLPGLLDDLSRRGLAQDPAGIIADFNRGHMASFPFDGVRIDWLKPVLPLYTRALARATPVEWTEGRTVRVVAPEGLVLTKMVAFRPNDQIDIDALLAINRDTIDVDQVRREWAPFATAEPERTAWLEATIDRRVVRRE